MLSAIDWWAPLEELRGAQNPQVAGMCVASDKAPLYFSSQSAKSLLSSFEVSTKQGVCLHGQYSLSQQSISTSHSLSFIRTQGGRGS